MTALLAATRHLGSLLKEHANTERPQRPAVGGRQGALTP